MAWIVSFAYGMYYLSLAKFFEPHKYALAWRVFKAISFTDEEVKVMKMPSWPTVPSKVEVEVGHESDQEWTSADERAQTPVED